jgi:transglutaminase-like putative cysteine protease
MKRFSKVMGAATVAAAMMLYNPVCTMAATNVRTPVASGTTTYNQAKTTIDASNISQGYVMVKYQGSREKIKVQISKGSTTYTYNLNAEDRYEVFPLSEGNGTYSIKVFENLNGNQYAQVASQDINASMSDPYAPFLYPNQYINFNSSSACVAKAGQLAAGASDDLAIVSSIFDYVVNNTAYDYAKANSVQSGYLPNPDSTLASHTGICFDYASLMVAMLRSQNIPTKLVIGYTGDIYHAWASVYIRGQGWLDNAIYFDGQNWSLADPTFMSTGANSDEAKAYVGNAANYQAKYSY